ncbi:hypothetical protein DZA36_01850 [Idiomarina sp. HD9-110m-PIT-SAG05]|nr:hypothetical protein DZA36_01850 [Idiomarina sp. HD9-110m-PIT-SAG05]
MQLFALVFIGFLPAILIAALIFSVIYYVWMVFDVIDRLFLEYLSLAFLDASGLYLAIALSSLLLPPFVIFLKSGVANQASRVWNDYILPGIICYVSFYLVLVSTLIFCVMVHLALIRESHLLVLVMLSPFLVTGLTYVVFYPAYLFLASWKESVRTMKIIMLSSLTPFVFMAMQVGGFLRVPIYQT